MCFSSILKLKRKTSVFKFFRFEERCRKVSFCDRYSVNGRPNRRRKASVITFLLRSAHEARDDLSAVKGNYISEIQIR